MSLHGTAALAMWWDMAPEMKSSTACFASLSEYCTGGDFMK